MLTGKQDVHKMPESIYDRRINVDIFHGADESFPILLKKMLVDIYHFLFGCKSYPLKLFVVVFLI